MDSFHSYIPLTSTPKRSTKSSCSQPLSSTLSTSSQSHRKMDLSISLITLIKKSSSHQKKRRRAHGRRQTHIHSSTIIKRIELKYLLYSTRTTKYQNAKQRHYDDNEMKIYVV
ncbi:unnamed protein product [Adineta ricciae]|uniref:Uncharacterized protein n=1 Tax=Adineta ricciae TaxID=249248 RepID=A0A814CCD8_ADIRI|nr:unnamed protein product [Adineta ricciae]